MLLCNATDVNAGLCLSPFIKSCGCWLSSTGRKRMASDVLLRPKTEKGANECSWGGGGSLGDPTGGDVIDSIKSKHCKLAKVKQWPQSVASVHGFSPRQETTALTLCQDKSKNQLKFDIQMRTKRLFSF